MVDMSETALNFGPEWLRALSHGNLPASPPASPGNVKFKLADYRYGREEMLALFSEAVKPPDGFKEEFHELYVDKCQLPLALSHLTSDEQRSWQRSVNSEAALRSMGRGGGTIPATLNASRGRGGSVDRGRMGRSRGGYYARPISLAEDDRDSNLIRRTRPGFERSSSLHERTWSERNGPEDTRGNRRMTTIDNWRTREKSDDDISRKLFKDKDSERDRDKWRDGDKDREKWRDISRENDKEREKWRETSREDWRDVEFDYEKHKEGSCGWRGTGNNYDKSGGDLCEDEFWSKSKTLWEDDIPKNNKFSDRGIKAKNSNSFRNHSNDRDLPEWSNISTSANLGSFDASGAFHGSEWDGDGEDKSDSIPNCIDELYNKDNNIVNEESVVNPVIPENVSNNSSQLTVEQEDSSCISNQTLFKSVESIDTQVPMTVVESNDNETDVQSDKQSQGLCNNHDKVSNVTEVKHERQIKSQNDIQLKNINAVHNNDDCIISQDIQTNVPIKEIPVSTTDHASNTMFPIPPALPQCPYSIESRNLSPSIQKLKSNEDENIENMKAVANNLVATLMEDDEKDERFKDLADEKWFYQDPQGQIQGPFTSTEMNEWFTAGYFSSDLLLRRECDERFALLGELIEIWEKIPFQPGPSPAPLKHLPVNALPSVPLLPMNNLDKVNVAMQQQIFQQPYQKQLLTHPQLPVNQQSNVQHLLSKLQQSDSWSTISPQQQKLINHQLDPAILQMKLMPQADQKSRPLVWPNPSSNDESILNKLKQPYDVESKSNNVPPIKMGVDPIQQLIAQMQAQTLAPKPVDPLQQLLLQLQKSCENSKTVPQVPLPPPSNHIHSIPPAIKPVVPPLVSPEPVASKSVPVDYVWGNTFGGWSVDQENERREREEKIKQQESAAAALKSSSLLNAWKQDDEDDEQRQAELRKEEERLKEVRKQVEDKIKMLEEVKQEEERRRLEEESRKKDEEVARKKDLEKRRKAEEQERKKEERRRQEILLQEEERRKVEEQKRLEKESQRLEDERQREMKQSEALSSDKISEHSSKANIPAWGGQGIKPSVSTVAPSLLEIQRMQEEKEKIEQKLKWQEAAMAQQKEQQQKKLVNLKWAKQTVDCGSIKSLAEIQAEEAEKLFREKEKEIAERVLSRSNSNTTGPAWNSSKSKLWSSKVASIFLPSSQSTWDSTQKGSTGNSVPGNVWSNTSQTLVTSNSTSPSWDGVPLFKTNSNAPANKSKSPKNSSSSSSGSSNKSGKVRIRKDDEQFTSFVEQTDGFTEWCTCTLSELQTSVDIPTFISFLKDVESPYEVTEYVKMYMESEKEAKEFAKQFLERRSKWKNAMKANHKVPEDNMCCPAAAITPSCAEFQEVKAKSRNKKKGSKMQKIDSSILGFNVTADPDRINVGERDFVEGM